MIMMNALIKMIIMLVMITMGMYILSQREMEIFCMKMVEILLAFNWKYCMKMVEILYENGGNFV